jgi:hypothetical protein
MTKRPTRSKGEIHPNSPVLRNPRFAQQVFDNARHPIVWLFVSRRLRSSAKIIFEKEEPIAQHFQAKVQDVNTVGEILDAPYFDAGYMLIAYAIENLLKGLMIAKGIVRLEGNEYPQIKGHDLRKLHQRAKPKTTVSLPLLDALTYRSEWRARYPLPLKLQDFWPMDEASGFPKGTGFAWPRSHDEFWKYCDELDAELNSLLSPIDQQRIDKLTAR